MYRKGDALAREEGRSRHVTPQVINAYKQNIYIYIHYNYITCMIYIMYLILLVFVSIL